MFYFTLSDCQLSHDWELVKTKSRRKCCLQPEIPVLKRLSSVHTNLSNQLKMVVADTCNTAGGGIQNKQRTQYLLHGSAVSLNIVVDQVVHLQLGQFGVEQRSHGTGSPSRTSGFGLHRVRVLCSCPSTQNTQRLNSPGFVSKCSTCESTLSFTN